MLWVKTREKKLLVIVYSKIDKSYDFYYKKSIHEILLIITSTGE